MPNADVLAQINRDVWIPFSAAYAHCDAEAFIALHCPDVIRVEGNGGWVGGFDEYAARLREWFQWVEVQEGRLDIRFRFLERHTGDDASSERGVYRLSLAYPDAEERLWYGLFHTVCRRRDGVWRIAVDYDSDEGGTIGEETYLLGQELDGFAPSTALS
ncbi:YybH family protein [Planosporangium sp. 12N6]|uniref:YybH family protein n=1 Tax=Planosporangium spinosum TaxID=3402278 RepID=UPI003CE71E7C